MVVNYLMQNLGSQKNKMWRPYVVSNKNGKRQAMRDKKLYNSKKKAISARKKKMTCGWNLIIPMSLQKVPILNMEQFLLEIKNTSIQKERKATKNC